MLLIPNEIKYLITIEMFVSTVASTASLGVVSFLLCESVSTIDYNIFCTQMFLVIMDFLSSQAIKKTRNTGRKSK